jgi:hypothetical protein
MNADAAAHARRMPAFNPSHPTSRTTVDAAPGEYAIGEPVVPDCASQQAVLLVDLEIESASPRP